MTDREELRRTVPWCVEGFDKWWARVYAIEHALAVWTLHAGILPLDDYLWAIELRRKHPRNKVMVFRFLWKKIGVQVEGRLFGGPALKRDEPKE